MKGGEEEQRREERASEEVEGYPYKGVSLFRGIPI